MNPAKKGLGKGLSALFGDIAKGSKINQSEVNSIQISDLTRNKYQPSCSCNATSGNTTR